MSLRVLHVSQPVVGGVATYVTHLAADQTRRGWDVFVAAPSHHPDGWSSAPVQHLAWEAERSPGSTVLREVVALARVIERVRPDVLHLHSSKAGLAGRLAVRGRTPTIFQPHGWPWQAVSGPLAGAAVRWEQLAIRWTDLVIAVSEDERSAGMRHGVRGHYAVIRNGVDLEAFTPGDRAGARRRLGIPEAPTAVCVGRLSEQKGQTPLVRTWRAVTEAVPGAHLYLVGDGPAAQAIRTEIVDAGVGGSVTLTGARADVHDWYTAADVVVLASVHGEAMALTPLEAQASGRPVVATAVNGVAESLATGAGTRVPVNDADALSGAITALLLDAHRAAAEGAVARRYAEEHLDIRNSLDAVARCTLDLAHRPVR